MYIYLFVNFAHIFTTHVCLHVVGFSITITYSSWKCFMLIQFSCCRQGLWLVWMHELVFWQLQTQLLDDTIPAAQWNRTFNFLQLSCLVLTCCGWYRTDQTGTMICDWLNTSHTYTSTVSSPLLVSRLWTCSWCGVILLSARSSNLSFQRSSQTTLWVSACSCFYCVVHIMTMFSLFFSPFHKCSSFVYAQSFTTQFYISSLNVFILFSLLPPGWHSGCSLSFQKHAISLSWWGRDCLKWWKLIPY